MINGLFKLVNLTCELTHLYMLTLVLCMFSQVSRIIYLRRSTARHKNYFLKTVAYGSFDMFSFVGRLCWRTFY